MFRSGKSSAHYSCAKYVLKMNTKWQCLYISQTVKGFFFPFSALFTRITHTGYLYIQRSHILCMRKKHFWSSGVLTKLTCHGGRKVAFLLVEHGMAFFVLLFSCTWACPSCVPAPSYSLVHPDTSSVSSLPWQNGFHRTRIIPSLVGSGSEDLKVKDCYLNRQQHSQHYYAVCKRCCSLVKEGNLHYKARYRRVSRSGGAISYQVHGYLFLTAVYEFLV